MHAQCRYPCVSFALVPGYFEASRSSGLDFSTCFPCRQFWRSIFFHDVSITQLETECTFPHLSDAPE